MSQTFPRGKRRDELNLCGAVRGSPGSPEDCSEGLRSLWIYSSRGHHGALFSLSLLLVNVSRCRVLSVDYLIQGDGPPAPAASGTTGIGFSEGSTKKKGCRSHTEQRASLLVLARLPKVLILFKLPRHGYIFKQYRINLA